MSADHESLTMQQLKDLKEVARLLGAGGMTESGAVTDASVTLSTANLSIPTYTLPSATSSVLGGFKTNFINGTRNYKVDLDTDNRAYVTVPWSDTNTDTYPGTGTNLVIGTLKTNYTLSGSYSGSYTYIQGTSNSSYRNGVGSTGNGSSNVGVWITSGGMLANGMILSYSDRRIKDNIEDVPDALALEQVRLIPCRYYEYKDKVRRGFEKTIGFIAQEVKEVLPMAVSTVTEIIPDHMKLGEVSWEEVDGTHLMMVSNLDADVTSGTKMKFICSTGTPLDLNEDGSIKTPASDDFKEENEEVVMRDDGKFVMKKQYDGIFIYGREVNDLNIICKDSIFTLHHSAIQELDKTVEGQKVTIASLEQKVALQESAFVVQETALRALQARVEAVENA